MKDWQPIETVPKDGTFVEVTNDEEVSDHRCVISYSVSFTAGEWHSIYFPAVIVKGPFKWWRPTTKHPEEIGCPDCGMNPATRNFHFHRYCVNKECRRYHILIEASRWATITPEEIEKLKTPGMGLLMDLVPKPDGSESDLTKSLREAREAEDKSDSTKWMVESLIAERDAWREYYAAEYELDETGADNPNLEKVILRVEKAYEALPKDVKEACRAADTARQWAARERAELAALKPTPFTGARSFEITRAEGAFDPDKKIKVVLAEDCAELELRFNDAIAEQHKQDKEIEGLKEIAKRLAEGLDKANRRLNPQEHSILQTINRGILADFAALKSTP